MTALEKKLIEFNKRFDIGEFLVLLLVLLFVVVLIIVGYSSLSR